MQIINARLRQQSESFTLHIENGHFTKIEKQDSTLPSTQSANTKPINTKILDTNGNLACVPFVELHIHLDRHSYFMCTTRRTERQDKCTSRCLPTDGMLSYSHSLKLMEEVLKIGADVVGGIPHF